MNCEAMESSRPRIAATAAAAAAALILYLRSRLRARELDNVEAYCQPCGDDDVGSEFHQPTLHRSRSALKATMAEPALSRQKSIVNDGRLTWDSYIEAPSTYAGAAGFNAAGAQRIDLPQFAGHEFDEVAAFIDCECATTLGLGSLGTMHRINTAERRAAWRAEFETLDLGSYDEACMWSPEHVGKLCWTVLIIQPHRSFPVHQHPDIEVEFVLRGALYENRLLAQPDAPLAEAALPDRGYPKLFRVQTREGGSLFSNPREPSPSPSPSPSL